MAQPTGSMPPATPKMSNYDLPPLPPSPDEVGGQAQQSAGDSTQNKPGQREQQKKQASQSGRNRPLMTQKPEPAASNRPRGGSMKSKVPDAWSSGSPSIASAEHDSAKTSILATSTTSLQSSANPSIKLRASGPNESGSRAGLAHARSASNSVMSMPTTQPQPPLQPSQLSQLSSLPDVPPPDDVPPPPKQAPYTKVPTLQLTKLTSASAAPSTPLTPTSTGRTHFGGVMNGEDVKLELRYFIDGVLDGRIGLDHSDYARQLGELLVHVESDGGAEPLSSTSPTKILRGGLRIHGYTRTSGGKPEEVNVIAQFSQPFVKQSLWTGESERVRQKILHEFDKVAGKIDALSKEGEVMSISELLKHPEFLRLMKPLEDTFIDYVCGPQRTLASSRLPDPIKQLLLSIDKHLIEWFEQSGTGKPKDLMALRTNALIGYLATRSVSVVWRDHCGEDFGGGDDGAAKATERYARLFPHLNKVASHKFADLVMDIVSTQPAQPKKTLDYVRAIQSPRQLIQKRTAAEPLSVSTNSMLQRGKNLNARALLISPRSSDSTIAENLKETKEAKRKLKEVQMRYQLERAKFAEKIINEAGLKSLDPRLMQKLKEKIVDMSRRGFDNFRRDPIPYCQDFAKDFYVYGDNVKKAGKDIPERVQLALAGLRDSFRISVDTNSEADTESSEETTVTMSNAVGLTTTTTMTTTTTTATTTVKPGSDTTPRGPVSDKGKDNAEEASDGSIIVSTPGSSRSDSSN